MKHKDFRPMLAAGKPKAWSKEKWEEHVKALLPLIATPKVDGIRCLCWSDGFPLTRSLKDIPNGSIRAYFWSNRQYIKNCLDGEIVVGDNFHNTSSEVMSFKGDPDFTYWIFDVPSDKPYIKRVDEYSEMDLPMRFKTLPTCWIKTYDDLLLFEAECLKAGYEGVCIRTPRSPYKYGRSTPKQGWLLKLKRFVDAEAEVIGFEPLMHNTNEAKQDALGHTVRSSEKAGMVESNMLGKFLLRGINDQFVGIEFNCGSGLTEAQRICFWENRTNLLGKIITFKYQEHGVLVKPRTPIFLRFRDAKDLPDA